MRKARIILGITEAFCFSFLTTVAMVDVAQNPAYLTRWSQALLLLALCGLCAAFSLEMIGWTIRRYSPTVRSRSPR